MEKMILYTYPPKWAVKYQLITSIGKTNKFWQYHLWRNYYLVINRKRLWFFKADDGMLALTTSFYKRLEVLFKKLSNKSH